MGHAVAKGRDESRPGTLESVRHKDDWCLFGSGSSGLGIEEVQLGFAFGLAQVDGVVGTDG